MMRIGSGLSQVEDTRQAAMESALSAREGLQGERATLAVVFASPHHADRPASVVDAVHEAAGPSALIGCVADGIIGKAREVEAGPSVSVWFAALPDEVEPFRLEFSRIGDEGYFSGWPDRSEGTFLLVADPFSLPADLFLRHLNVTVPGAIVIGGMSSGA